METVIKRFANLYRDSVALMRIAADVSALPGIEQASLVMGTPANKDLLVESGLVEAAPEAEPGDLLVVIRGEHEAIPEAVKAAESALNPAPVAHTDSDAEPGPFSLIDALSRERLTLKRCRTLREALEGEDDAGPNLALISTPGEYAGAEALKAIRAGLHVMLFSDNVPLEQEMELKREAGRRQVLVMGPDCGTAIINGVPLAFANEVQRGSIGIVGASGTGIQQVSCLVHQLGGGISQALGCGGRDLSQEVGGLSMLAGLQLLIEDPETRIIILLSKPPASEVADRILGAAKTTDKPVLINFLGASQPLDTGGNLYWATTLEEAAHRAVALQEGRNPDFISAGPEDPALLERTETLVPQHSGRRRFLRALYTGGTFCAEAQLLLAQRLEPLFSNTPVSPALPLESPWTSREHTVLDLGDDVFTRGRPHPMLDPAMRNERLIREAADPETGVILVDVVLGYGSHPDPAGELVKAVQKARQTAGESSPVFIGFVCGTDEDPQPLSAQKALLEAEGVHLCSSNAQAVMLALLVLRRMS